MDGRYELAVNERALAGIEPAAARPLSGPLSAEDKSREVERTEGAFGRPSRARRGTTRTKAEGGYALLLHSSSWPVGGRL